MRIDKAHDKVRDKVFESAGKKSGAARVFRRPAAAGSPHSKESFRSQVIWVFSFLIALLNRPS